MSSSIKSKEREPNSRHTIEFLPWLRHFRITYTPHGENPTTEVFMIHETRPKKWEPVPQ